MNALLSLFQQPLTWWAALWFSLSVLAILCVVGFFLGLAALIVIAYQTPDADDNDDRLPDDILPDDIPPARSLLAMEAPKRHALRSLPPSLPTPLTTPQPGTPVDRPPALSAEVFRWLAPDELERLADVGIRLANDPDGPTTSPRWRDDNAAYLFDDESWEGRHELRAELTYYPPTEPHIRPLRWGDQGDMGDAAFWRDPRDAWADPLLLGYDATWADRVDWTGWDDDGQQELREGA
ncbi:MAG TPA: hypothetical protein VMV29_08800 [Ktedonobacterales bacterium]|nr:hypothetical protein [Ktedonobacterales bacterium]